MSDIMMQGIGINKIFGSRSQAHQVLFDVNIDVHQGECIAIIGGSGSGKSTLTRILMGLESASSGQVLWRGQPIIERDVLHSLREHSGIVYQNPFSSLDPRWTVYRSIREPLKLRDKSMSEDECVQRVRDALTLVSLDPDVIMQRYPMDLSGGQAQRVAIARAIVTDPCLLLADEAMSAIDVSARLQILEAFAAIRERNPNMAMMMVSHDLGVVQHIADHILVLHDGHVIEQGSAQQILNNPQESYTQALVQAATM